MNKLSLFSGIGGDDLASEWAGIKTVCFVEKDKFCQQVLKKHWPDIPIIGDVHEVTKTTVKEACGCDYFDIIGGGDPCQPRSIAGKRRGSADDRDLWPEMFRIISEFKPAWVVNENPTGRLAMDFHQVLSDLESLGYQTRAFVIPACAVNACHRRDRLFIVANSDQYGLKGGWHVEDKGELADKQIEIPATWNIPCKSFKDWEVINNKTGCCRRYDGLPLRMAKVGLQQFGNSVVPQQVYPFYRAIVEVSKGNEGSIPTR